MTFQDRTFCSGDGCTKFDACPRAFNAAAEKAAAAWWGGPGAPVSLFMFPRTLNCYSAPSAPSAPVAADPDDEEDDPGEDIDNFPTARRTAPAPDPV